MKANNARTERLRGQELIGRVAAAVTNNIMNKQLRLAEGAESD